MHSSVSRKPDVPTLLLRVEGLAIVALAVICLEFFINRLGAFLFAPPVDEAPTFGYAAISYIGLFLMYFSTAMSVCVVALASVVVANIVSCQIPSDGRKSRLGTWVLRGISIIFCGSAVATLIFDAADVARFSGLVMRVSLLCIILAGWTLAWKHRRTWPKNLRIVLICWIVSVPTMVAVGLHIVYVFYAPFVHSDAAHQIQVTAQYFVLASGVVVGCLLPWKTSSKIPGMVAIFVTALVVILMRQRPELAMQLAESGLGVDIGPSGVNKLLQRGICSMSAGVMAWTIVTCLLLDNRRRLFGVGLAIYIFSGLSLDWPMQHATLAAGLLSMVLAIGFVSQRTAEPGGSSFDSLQRR